jgi:hypothetical protein
MQAEPELLNPQSKIDNRKLPLTPVQIQPWCFALKKTPDLELD